MNLPFPNDPASLSQPNPLFNDNAFVRGDQFRDNNQKAWQNFDYIQAFFNSIFKGYAYGKLLVLQATPKIMRVPVRNRYEVNEKLINITTELTLDFNGLTNIFRSNGIDPITNNSETRDKHLYLLLTDLGILQAMIIPDPSEIPDHNFLTNPLFLESYYTNSPSGLWDNARNGYYKNNKRVIAHLRLDNTNTIQFFYELGYGQRFQDVESLAIGNLFSELRYKRCHPNCYLANGATITAMSTQAPQLHRILGTNVLPNFNDRFLRNIDIAGSRNMRDLQADAFQGHLHEVGNDALGQGGAGSTRLVSLPTALRIATSTPISDGVNGTPRTASETRPLNFAGSLQIVRG